MMNLSHLKQLLARHGISQTDLARILRRDKSVVTNLFQGRRQLKASEAALIAAHIGVPVAQVLGITEPNMGGGGESAMLIPFQQEPARIRKTTNIVKKEDRSYLISGANVPYSPKAYVLEVADESMNLSGILPGDIVVSEIDRPCKPGQIVVAEHSHGQGARTIIRKYQPPFLTPHSTATGFKPLNIEKDEVRLVSPVTKLIRAF